MKRIKQEYCVFWKSPHPFNPLVLSPFEVNGTVYSCPEQYVAAQKARLFLDYKSYDLIMAATTGRDFRGLSKCIRGYNHDTWLKERYRLMIDANYYKFSQNRQMRDRLQDTGSCVMVYANPHDRVWGVGMDGDHPDILNSDRWQGDNLLGRALMHVREELFPRTRRDGD